MRRTATIAMSCPLACHPDPISPTVRASWRARYFAPSPFVAPTRSRCRYPSGKIASGSPVSELNSRTSPTQRPPGTAGTFSRRAFPPRLGQVTMSELIRTAPTPSDGAMPSIDFRE